ncbi:hypothetical protein J6P92_08175 [bacterium]|nr:hypothetical protein [bacterium]
MIIKKNIIQRQGDSVEDIEEAEVSPEEEQLQQEEPQEETIDIFNLDDIDFKQRNERRRGDRRRGFRRIDDRNLISRAKEEAQSIKESAQKEGYQEGLEQAKADIEEVRNSLTAFINAKQEVFDSVAPYVMEISFDIAKKIIKKEIEQDNTIILDNIQQLLKTLSKEEAKITLKVNPVQVSLIKTEVPEMLNNAGLEAKILVVPDEAITEGGCLIETTNGVIDATIETQLSVISEALKEV